MSRRLLYLLPVFALLDCASPYRRIDGYVPDLQALGLDTSALPLPAGWPENCHAVNLSFAMAAECGGRTLHMMRFAFEAGEKGYRKAFAKMFPEMEMRNSDWKGPAGSYAFQGDSKDEVPGDSQYNLGFFIKDGKGILAFHCLSQFPADSAFCGPALVRVASKGWSELNPALPDTSSFDFAGRKIEAGPICRFMGGRNYQCPNNGQLSWGEFALPEEAANFLRNHVQSTVARRGVRVAASDTVDCTLEEQATRCLVNTYKVVSLDPRVLALPKLVALYAQAEVRGRQVAVVCSFYQDERPVLCNEILETKEELQGAVTNP